MGFQERIEEIFELCANSQGIVDFPGICKIFWSVLDNNASICDLAGVFTVTNPAADSDTLDLQLFTQFLNGISRIKYPLDPDHTEKLIDDLFKSRGIIVHSETASFIKAVEKSVTRVLLKFDMPLRRAFSNFAGRDITIGGGLTWDEVKRLNVGMEIDGFTSFAGAHSLIPSSLSIQQCSLLAREVAAQYPLLATSASNNTILLYPQFQLLLCFTAIERNNANLRNTLKTPKIASHFPARKTPTESSSAHNSSNTSTMADMLHDLLKVLGIDLLRQNQMPLPNSPSYASLASKYTPDGYQSGYVPTGEVYPTGIVVLPSTNRPEDQYTSATHQGRQLMHSRLERLFDEITEKLQKVKYSATYENQLLASLLPTVRSSDDVSFHDLTSKFATKPVVIGDAVPVPSMCPPAVEQLLESALAHHNLGSFQEALKFLEAAKIQQIDLFRKEAEERRVLELERSRQLERERERARIIEEAKAHTRAKGSIPKEKEKEKERDRDRDSSRKDKKGSSNITVASDMSVSALDTVRSTESRQDYLSPSKAEAASATAPIDTRPPVEHELYIVLCKGNVYQSSGDDEQALMQYIGGWERSVSRQSADWELVCINSIGLLCYFNLRYDLAQRCFTEVVAYRNEVYGNSSADTATALNNLACALYCLGRKGEARVRFDRAWSVMSNVLGHRHPRTVIAWRNLDKARRSQASLSHADLKESLSMRPDHDKLLLGGEFTIQANAPLPAKKLRLKSARGKSSNKKK